MHQQSSHSLPESSRLEDVAATLGALTHDILTRTPLTTYPEICESPEARMVAVFTAVLHGPDAELDEDERAYLNRLGPATARLLAPRRKVA